MDAAGMSWIDSRVLRATKTLVVHGRNVILYVKYCNTYVPSHIYLILSLLAL